jgi:hypothetical protein
LNLLAHFATAIIGGTAALFLSGWQSAALFFAGASLIDADHVLDYFLIYKRLDFGKMLAGHFYQDKIYVVLHSFEIPILALLLFPSAETAWLAAGFALHLAMDLAEYPFKNPLATYFFAYRALVGFSRKRLCANCE